MAKIRPWIVRSAWVLTMGSCVAMGGCSTTRDQLADNGSGPTGFAKLFSRSTPEVDAAPLAEPPVKEELAKVPSPSSAATPEEKPKATLASRLFGWGAKDPEPESKLADSAPAAEKPVDRVAAKPVSTLTPGTKPGDAKLGTGLPSKTSATPATGSAASPLASMPAPANGAKPYPPLPGMNTPSAYPTSLTAPAKTPAAGSVSPSNSLAGLNPTQAQTTNKAADLLDRPAPSLSQVAPPVGAPGSTRMPSAMPASVTPGGLRPSQYSATPGVMPASPVVAARPTTGVRPISPTVTGPLSSPPGAVPVTLPLAAAPAAGMPGSLTAAPSTTAASAPVAGAPVAVAPVAVAPVAKTPTTPLVAATAPLSSPVLGLPPQKPQPAVLSPLPPVTAAVAGPAVLAKGPAYQYPVAGELPPAPAPKADVATTPTTPTVQEAFAQTPHRNEQRSAEPPTEETPPADLPAGAPLISLASRAPDKAFPGVMVGPRYNSSVTAPVAKSEAKPEVKPNADALLADEDERVLAPRTQAITASTGTRKLRPGSPLLAPLGQPDGLTVGNQLPVPKVERLPFAQADFQPKSNPTWTGKPTSPAKPTVLASASPVPRAEPIPSTDATSALAPVAKYERDVTHEAAFDHGSAKIENASVLLQQARSKYLKIDNYQVRLTWQHRTAEGTLSVREQADMNVRRDPLAIHVAWHPDPQTGRHWLYSTEGKRGRLRIREATSLGSIAMTVAPNDPMALEVHPRPITEWGFNHWLRQAVVALQRQQDGGPEVEFLGLTQREGRDGICYKLVLPSYQDKPQTELYFDQKTLLPVEAVVLDTRGNLLQSEVYERVQVNMAELNAPLAFDSDSLFRR